MAVQSSYALEQYIDGAEVGYEQVGIYIEGLFERLRSYNHASAAAALPAEPRFHGGVQQLAIFSRESAGVQSSDAVAAE